MWNAFIQFLLFFAETAVLVIAILIVIAGIVAIASKGKLKDKAKITVRKLNKFYEDMAETINDEVLSKDERKKLEKTEKKSKKHKKEHRKRVFVINFSGDIKASTVDSLREEISAILMVANHKDEVILKLESAGGMMHAYGLAASQLQRIKEQNIPLTVIVDKVAASGGYMMACVANKLIAAPFAIIGSIGVVAQTPNFNRFLKKHDVDFEQFTGGEYKRTVSLFGEVTKEGRKKFQEETDEAHELFKDFVKSQRPQIDINEVATGEHWFATQALPLNLVDELQTSDDYLVHASKTSDIHEIKFKRKQKFSEKIGHLTQATVDKLLSLSKKDAEENLFI